MLQKLQEIVAGEETWTEVRYHERKFLDIEVRNGILKKAAARTLAGAGIRVLTEGSWGFVSTSDISEEGIKKAIREAVKAAEAAGELKKEKVTGLARGKPAKGTFHYAEEKKKEPELKEKIDAVLQSDEFIRNAGQEIVGSITNYAEFKDYKVIINSDGAAAEIFDPKADFSTVAIAVQDGKREMAHASSSVTGGWNDLFQDRKMEDFADKAVNTVRAKLKADYAPGGQYTVIMDPTLVGVLAHEAIGHTVEADMVESGSVVADKIDQKVASDLVSMVDDGTITGAAGMVLVDDEGTLGQKTVLIEKGILKNFLHNKESAKKFNTEPLGNARAFTYQDEPIIRMTNTFILPGDDTLENMIKGVQEGFFLKGLGQGGQADVTAEFMFSVQEAYWIRNGEIAEPVKGITISGQAFEVLKSVDAVSKEFKIDLGRGYCGKWQPAKVDAGGPYLRCRVTIGGQQN